MSKVIVIGHTAGMSVSMNMLAAQFPKAEIIIVGNLKQAQQIQEQQTLIEQNVKTFKIEPVMHDPLITIETTLPKPYIKVKKNHFDRHKFKKR